MAYNEKLADRVRTALAHHKAVEEKKMMGGLTFMFRGNMCCGVLQNNLVVRVGARQYEKALAYPHVRPMDFTGRPLKGFVFVDPAGFRTDRSLKKWIKLAVDFVRSLPPK